MKTKDMVLCAVFAAILCVLSVITVPIGPVPITLGYLGVMLTAVVLGPKKGVISVAVYIALGCIGLPVFSGFKGGFGVLLGPTGGYAWSYIIMAFVIGLMTKKLFQKKWLAAMQIFIACSVGGAISYAAGTAQFMAVMDTGLGEAMAMCVIPFIPFDIGKAVVTAIIGLTVCERTKKAGLEK